MTETYAEVRKTISEAITVLEMAEDKASGSQQLLLLDIIEGLHKERIKIDLDRLAQSNDTYVALTQDIKGTQAKLDELTEEVKELIENAEKVAKVAGVLAKLVKLAARVAV